MTSYKTKYKQKSNFAEIIDSLILKIQAKYKEHIKIIE